MGECIICVRGMAGRQGMRWLAPVSAVCVHTIYMQWWLARLIKMQVK